MACIKCTFIPENGQQLEESIKECTKEGLMPILQAGVQVNGRSLLDAKELKGKEVAFINIEKLEKKESEEPVTTFIKQDQKELKFQTEVIERLQARVGFWPRFKSKTFHNWAKNQTSSVISCSPRTKQEMSEVIKAAFCENVGIRCAGSRHSWAPVFADSGQISVKIKNLKSDYTSQTNIRIADLNKRTVDVMAGVTTGDLKAFQLQTKLHLNTNVILDLVQMVSVAQTGCHGVGINTHCLSDYLVKMRVFDSNGKLQTYRLEDDEPLFRAVSAGFGCFGIVYDMTIKMDSEVIVKTCNFYPNMASIFNSEEKLREIINNNWAVEIFWFPFNAHPIDLSKDELWVRTFKKICPEAIVKVEGVEFYETKDMYDHITQAALRIVSPFITKCESIVPLMQWLSFLTIKNVLYPERDDSEPPLYQEIPNAVHFRKYLEKAKVYDLEFVFDYNAECVRLTDIINVVVENVKSFQEKKQYPLNVSLEMRFMSYSDAYLGTGSIANTKYGGSGDVVCIEVLCLKGTESWKEFSEAVGQKWIEMGGVPHLAKQYDQLEGVFESTRSKMTKQIEAFNCQLTESEADPSGMFLNMGMRRLLGKK